MLIVSVPNFSGELSQTFLRNIAVIRGDLVHPNNELMLLLHWKFEHTSL